MNQSQLPGRNPKLMDPKITLAHIGWRRTTGLVLGLLLLAIVAFHAGKAFLVDARGPILLIVYAFSTQEEVLTQAVFPGFTRYWESQTGQDLQIEGVFGPSGTLASQINLGAPAHVALLSNEHHVNWLKVGRRVRSDNIPQRFSYTPMVIVTRPGNPHGIEEYSDLAAPGLRLIHANPSSSGGGAWAVLAEYGSALLQRRSAEQAHAQLTGIWQNVAVMAPSARSALTLFELGAGDALVTYEQDALLARDRGVALEIVAPTRTIAAQHVAVLVDDNVRSLEWDGSHGLRERTVAQAFIEYLTGEEGQRALQDYHWRPDGVPGNVGLSSSDAAIGVFTVDALGGWPRAYRDVVEALWQDEILPSLPALHGEQGQGGPG